MARKLTLGKLDTLKALGADLSQVDLEEALNFLKFVQRSKYGVKKRTRKVKAPEAATKQDAVTY